MNVKIYVSMKLRGKKYFKIHVIIENMPMENQLKIIPVIILKTADHCRKWTDETRASFLLKYASVRMTAHCLESAKNKIWLCPSVGFLQSFSLRLCWFSSFLSRQGRKKLLLFSFSLVVFFSPFYFAFVAHEKQLAKKAICILYKFDQKLLFFVEFFGKILFSLCFLRGSL